jgi:hypothetical protein
MGDRIMYNENNIDGIITVILSSKGYHKVPILQEGTNCYLKRYSDKLGYYVLCHYDKKGISIHFYFTGIMMPDINLMDFYAGIHLEILEMYNNTTEEPIIVAVEKIKAIEPYLETASEIILQELMNPILPIEKLFLYRDTIIAYDILKNDENLQQKFALLEKELYKVCKKKLISKKEQIICNSLMDQFPQNYFAEKGFLNIEELRQNIILYIYAQGLFEE